MDIVKRVSILGDSVSTYTGWNPEGYAVFYENGVPARNGMNSYRDTWWARVLSEMGAELCVNDSYSGSKVSGKDFPAANSAKRIEALKTEGVFPDYILIYIGFNDWGNGVIAKKRGIPLFRKEDMSVFYDAYRYMLRSIKTNYPDTKTICGTLMRTKIRDNGDWVFPERYAGVAFIEYNSVIREVCRREHCLLADLALLDIQYETLDGSHPTAKGHKIIADCWMKYLAKLI